MQRLIAILIFFLASQLSYSQDVDIPDGAFLFVLIYEGHDTNNDHVIQVSEAEAVTSLFLANKIISSIEGISAFVNLTTLHANRNRLSGTLDLRTLVNLRDLNIAENNLEGVNIEGLVNLVDFNADENNLTSLNLQGLDNLRTVSAGSNSLSEFSISGLSSLATLDLGGNRSMQTIELSDLPRLTDFKCRTCGIIDMSLMNLPNLDDVDLFSNDSLIEYTFSGFPNLTDINVSGCSNLTTLGLENLPQLRTLDAWSSGLESLLINDCPKISSLDLSRNALVQLELKNLPVLLTLELDDNALEEIDLSELSALRTVLLNNNFLRELDASGLSQLRELNVENNLLEEIVLENLPFLSELILTSNNLTTVDLSGLTALEVLRLESNQLVSLDLLNLTSLASLQFSSNQLTELTIENLNALSFISASDNPLHTISLANLPLLKSISLTSSQLTNTEFVNLPSVETLNLSSNQLASLDISSLISLRTLTLDDNSLTSLDLNDLVALREISITDNLLTSLSIQEKSSLNEINLQRNKLTGLTLSVLDRVRDINISENEFTELILHGLPLLETLNCEQSLLTNLQLYDLPRLESLICSDNKLERLDIFTLPNLEFLDCTDNVLKEMDFSSRAVRQVDMSNNALEFISFKNEEAEGNQMQFANNPDLTFICIDEEDFGDIVGKIIIYEMDTEVIRNCELTDPSFYEISGKTTFDVANDGCSEDDPIFRNLKFIVESGDEETCYISPASGFYSVLLSGPEHTLTPVIDEDLYEITPESISIDFGDLSTRSTKLDFCITPKVNFTDLNVNLVSLSQVRPGFEAEYKLIYRNRGVFTSSGQLTLTYDENLSELVETSSTILSNSNGQIVWSFEDLEPQETRVIFFNLEMNRPQDTPPLLGDEVLKFLASVTTDVEDFDLTNNESALCQTVVNSYDPNDKQCSQGEAIKPEQLGDYLNYVIRFENTGTASAINIMVIDEIDQEKYDINTLEIVDASHEMTTRIVDGNIVNFVFDDIRLPFDDENNDGYIAFKIKPLPTLELGEVIANSASIFFDFNDPILTNTAETVILRDDDNDGYFEDVDCDDENADINPGNTEISYNGLDDDCDPLTLDDDLDGDGFILEEDCDDENADINPGNTEISYNEIDDDCDPQTLDDDLDGDGFVLEEDCDDENADINPAAEEISNNGIDEDCDGEDLLTSVKELAASEFSVFPNPAKDYIYIETRVELNFEAILLDINGRKLVIAENINVIDVSTVPNGIYFLEIREIETGKVATRKIILENL